MLIAYRPLTLIEYRLIMKRILWIGFVCALCMGVRAQQPQRVPARPGVIARVQPNGDTLHVVLRGDERSHYTMTVDGWQVKEDRRGWLKYAKRNRRGEIVAGCRKAHDADRRKKCEIKWIQKYGIKG